MLKYIANEVALTKAEKIQEIKTRAVLTGPVKRYVDILLNDVIVSNSHDASYEISPKTSWPMGREHAHIVNYANFDYTSANTGTLSNFYDAAAFFVERKFQEQHELWVVKVFDKVNFTETKTIIERSFSTSKYLTDISSVINAETKSGQDFINPEMSEELGLNQD